MSIHSPSTSDRTASEASFATDKQGYAARWGVCRRTVDNLLAAGLPHLKLGTRRVRIVIADADEWMRARFGTRRLGSASAPAVPTKEAL